jgi:hypothetical protein
MTFAIGQRVFLKMTFKYFKIGHVFADMNLKGSIPLMILSVRFVGHKKKGNQNRKR